MRGANRTVFGHARTSGIGTCLGRGPAPINVRFGSKADIQRYPLQCPLLGVKRTLNRPATQISLRDYESAVQTPEIFLGFAKGKAGSRESLRLFARKSNSTRGCNRSRDALEGAGQAICESRGVGVWYGPKENSLRLLSFLGFKAGLQQPSRAEVIHCHNRALLMFVPVP